MCFTCEFWRKPYFIAIVIIKKTYCQEMYHFANMKQMMRPGLRLLKDERKYRPVTAAQSGISRNSGGHRA